MRKENVNEWLYYYHMKNEEALPFLLRYFRPMVLSIAQKKLNDECFESITISDYLAMADTLLVDVLDRYREDQNASFETLYYQCLEYRTIDIIRSIQRHYVPYKINSLSMDSHIDKSTRVIADVISDPCKVDLHRYVVESNHVEYLFDIAKDDLSAMDMEIMRYRYEGYTIKEISEMYSTSVQAIHYHIKNIRIWLQSH